jgi:hypothetical protein
MDHASMHAKVKELHPDYMAGSVAWNDGKRTMYGNGQLSCYGPNITDARLTDREGTVFAYVRSDNLDEKLGVTTADKLHLVDGDGTPMTLQAFLEACPEYTKYRGISIDPKTKERERVVFRVQNAFVPFTVEQEGREVAVSHYSYGTRDDSDPQNMLWVCNAKGIFAHADTSGVNPLVAHDVASDGTVHERYFWAAPTREAVGSASSGGGGEGAVIGFEGMGARVNCFLVVSMPLVQRRRSDPGLGGSDDVDDLPVYRSLCGDASVARMSVSKEVSGRARAYDHTTALVRDEEELVTVTMVLFNSVTAREATTQVHTKDLALAIEDMERIYAMGDATCKLSQLPEMLARRQDSQLA